MSKATHTATYTWSKTAWRKPKWWEFGYKRALKRLGVDKSNQKKG